MLAEVSVLRRSLKGSILSYAHYQAEPVDGKEWIFSVKLETGEIAYLLSDISIPKRYSCPMSSNQLFRGLGSHVKVEVVPWGNIQVVVKIEAVPCDELPKCSTCDQVVHYSQTIFDTQQSILDFGHTLKRLVANSQFEEFIPDGDERNQQVKLAQFGPKLPYPTCWNNSTVYIMCKECKAEWCFVYDCEKSTPGFGRRKAGFRY